MAAVLADTGALVALLDRTDKWHPWAVGIFKTLPPPIFTCQAVLTEAWHLLAESGPSRNALARLHKVGVLRVGLDFEPATVHALVSHRDHAPVSACHSSIVSPSNRASAAGGRASEGCASA